MRRSSRRRAALLGALWLAALTGCTGTDEPDAIEDDIRGPTIAYAVEIEGDADSDLLDLLRDVSSSVALEERPPPSLLALRQRVADDVLNLQRALRSEGFYDARIDTSIDRDKDPVGVRFEVETGPVYRFGALDIEVIGGDGGFEPPDLADLGLESGAPALAKAVIDGEQKLLRAARRQGYALARLGDRTTIVDHPAEAMDVTYRIMPGDVAYLASPRIMGFETIDEAHIRKQILWNAGDRYDPELVKDARDRLVETGLFASVRVDEGKEVGPDGRLPVDIELTERKHRTISATIRYRSDEGPGGEAYWENRNLFGAGESLRIRGDASRIRYTLGAEFRKPSFFDVDQTWVTGTEFQVEDTKAYNSRTLTAGTGIERFMGVGRQLTYGIAYKLSGVDEPNEKDEEYAFVFFPVLFEWNTSNDILDPTEGGRLAFDGAPFVDTLGSSANFLRGKLGYAHYLKVLDKPRIVFAARSAVGGLVGADRDDVPANERLYSGGGGSVRGLRYQFAGPLDEDNNPVGGRSLFEINTEIRTRVTENLGVGVFLDGGSVFGESYPSFSESIRWGAGAGLRYFTPIGPLRFDFAVPVNKRSADDPFQFYISLGPAF